MFIRFSAFTARNAQMLSTKHLPVCADDMVKKKHQKQHITISELPLWFITTQTPVEVSLSNMVLKGGSTFKKWGLVEGDWSPEPFRGTNALLSE